MLEWPDATIFDGIADVATRAPEKTALRFEGEETSYRELIGESRALAHGLADLGIEPGNMIGVWLSNRPEWIKAQLAASYLGAAIVAVNTRYRTHELEYMLNDSQCNVLITEERFLGNEYLEMLADVLPGIKESSPDEFDPTTIASLQEVIALESNEDYPAVRAYESVEAAGSNRGEIDSADDAEAPACVFYTSGTTSDPKGCLQSNRSLLNHSYQVGVHLSVLSDDVALGTLPYCGVFGYNMFMSALAHGIPQVIQTHFDVEGTLDRIERNDVTYMSGLATMYQRILEAADFEETRVETLSKGAIGFLSQGFEESLFEEIEERFGFPVCQPYGLSEGNSQIFMGDPGDPIDIRKNVGGPLVFPEAEEAKVVDVETGDELTDGEVGELCLRGVNVMSGYLGKPEETENATDEDGWFYPGDLARRDPETGYFYYQSRMDDALRIRGFLVAPRDIESVLDEHPDVELSQVVGAPHPRHGQVAVAFVKRTTADSGLDEHGIRQYLEDHVADYKIPEDVIFIESFPRSEGPHGEKIRKADLRDRVSEEYVTK